MVAIFPCKSLLLSTIVLNDTYYEYWVFKYIKLCETSKLQLLLKMYFATDLEVNSVMSAEVLNHTVLQVKLITSTPFIS